MPSRPAILGGRPIRPQGPPIWPQNVRSIESALRQLFESGDWGRYQGTHVPELTRRMSQYHNLEFVHPCSSGTVAVELALRGMSVGTGHEVILAAYDFKANFQNVLTVGAVPVLVDISADNGQIDPSRIADAITERTKAVIVSHLHGGVVDIPAVVDVARPKNLLVLEDACQNPGALVSGRKAGSGGDIGVLSFGGSKLLTAGRGGAVLTNRSDLFERIRRYVHRGNDAYPLSEMQAAVLLPQLDLLDARNETRLVSVWALSEGLQDIPGLTLLQPPNDLSKPVYYKVGFRYREAEWGGLSRNRFAAAMRAEGVAMHPGFRGLHLIHAKRRFRAAGELVEATRADEEFLTLHHPILLEGKSGVDEILEAVNKVRRFAEEIASSGNLSDDRDSVFDE